MFVGTSLAVGLTETALLEATKRKVPCFSFNTATPVEFIAWPKLEITHVLGPAATVLPVLETAMQVQPTFHAEPAPPGSKRRRLLADAAAAADNPVASCNAESRALSASSGWQPGPVCTDDVRMLVNQTVEHDASLPLSILDGVTPGDVFTLNEPGTNTIAAAVLRSECGFYVVVGNAAMCGTAAVEVLLGEPTPGWQFLYSHPNADWVPVLSKRLGAVARPFSRSYFATPSTVSKADEALAMAPPLPTGIRLSRM